MNLIRIGGLSVFGVEQGGDFFGVRQKILEIVVVEIVVCFFELVLEVGGHFLEFEFQIVPHDLFINVHDANSDVCGYFLLRVGVRNMHQLDRHQIEYLDNLIHCVTLQ